MYNRYIPNDTSYTRVEPEAPVRPKPPDRPGGREGEPAGRAAAPFAALLGGKDGLGGLFSGIGGGGRSGLLKALKLEQLDAGDVLLLLILLFLLVEGDDLELVIALGVVLLMGLGDGASKDGEREAAD